MSTPDRTLFAEAAEALAAWRRPLLVTHAKPDGDALGSLAAMRALLRGRGVDATCLLFDAIPDRYAMFRRYDRMRVFGHDLHEADLAAFDAVVVLDTCTYNQLEPLAQWLREASVPKLAIDHHVTRDDLADGYVIDESAAATCLILHDWAKALRWDVSAEAAEAMFIGIAMDTGWFRHANTDGRVFTAAAEIVARGVKPAELYEPLYQRESQARVRLLGAALASLELLADDRLAVMTLSAEAMRQVGATPADTEDVVNEPLRIGSVMVSVLLVEQEKDLTRVNLRSKAPRTGEPAVPDVDVARIAQQLGGGGHRRAAGARVTSSIVESRTQVIQSVMKAMGMAHRSN